MFNIQLETFNDIKGIGIFANSKDYYFVKQNIDGMNDFNDYVYDYEWVIAWLLLNPNSAMFQLYHGENKLIFNEMMMSALY